MGWNETRAVVSGGNGEGILVRYVTGAPSVYQPPVARRIQQSWRNASPRQFDRQRDTVQLVANIR